MITWQPQQAIFLHSSDTRFLAFRILFIRMWSYTQLLNHIIEMMLRRAACLCYNNNCKSSEKLFVSEMMKNLHGKQLISTIPDRYLTIFHIYPCHTVTSCIPSSVNHDISTSKAFNTIHANKNLLEFAARHSDQHHWTPTIEARSNPLSSK